MRAFIGTLFGGVSNLSVVAAIMALEIALLIAGHAAAMAYIIPPVTLAGVAWLARR
ncbi:MAG: hypothetical protein ACREF3_11780 [Acetobacteraceae bacterium]